MKHRCFRRLGSLALALALALSCAALPAWAADADTPTTPDAPVDPVPEPDAVRVTDVTLGQTQLALKVGGTATLTATVSPSNATNKALAWTSSDDTVATVDEKGKVTAVGVGRATITATAKGTPLDGQPTPSDTCVVNVSAADPALTLDTEGLFLVLGGEAGTITATTAGPVKEVTWKSSNEKSLTVSANSAGNIHTATIAATGEKAFTATVTVTATFDHSRTKTLTKSFKVTVADGTTQLVTELTLNKDKLALIEGETFQLTAAVSPSNAASKAVDWRSTDPSVATVDKNGKVTAVSGGADAAAEATIIATPRYGNVKKICIVTVTPAAEQIDLVGDPDSSGKHTVTFGKYHKVSTAAASVKLTPAGSKDPILWQSKDSTVATVADTRTTSTTITRRSAGKTTVTATPLGPDGKPRSAGTKAELTVIVSGIRLEKHALTLGENQQDSVGYETFGDAETGGADNCEWDSSDPAVFIVDTKSGLLTARGKGTALVTVSKQVGDDTYTDSCTVTVVEDASGLITLTGNHPAGSPVSMYSSSASSAAGSGTLASVLDAVCREKTKVINADGTTSSYGLSYISGLSVQSTDQGILHDQHHSSDDTGAGVGVQDAYYPSGGAGRRSLQDLSFVPRTTFSGTAEIGYTGHAVNNKTFTGVIHIDVNGTGDVMYSSSEGSAAHFLADDFNLYHPSLRSVSFTPPLDSRGTLYYNYSSAAQPGQKVTAGDVYYRTGTPGLDRVAFVPAAGYEGTVTISYRGTDTAGRSFTGAVTISVTNNRGGTGAPADIYYAAAEDGWVSFQPFDFSNACRNTLGEALSYVRFTLPPSDQGTLFYHYRGFGSYEGTVSSTASYYYSGTPALGGVSFVPTTTTPGQVDIAYTGYTVRGNTFTGTIHIGKDGPAQQGGLRYTVFTGKSAYFSAYDFNSACVAATGASLDYVQFAPLPAVGEGTLRYTRGSSSTTYSVSTSTRCYRSSSNSWDAQLNNVSFLSNTTYIGTVVIPFTGYNTNGASFTGHVVITVTPPTSGDSVYYRSTASPISLSSSRIRSACAGALDGTLSYITFTTLPSASAGRLYLNYRNFYDDGTQVNTGERYYVSSYPGIDQISFVPRGRFNGQVNVGYTATNTNGKSVAGLITFNITSTAASTHFTDMGNHTWAAPAVDYLYENGVTKGVTSTEYGPQRHITRADFVLMLCRAFHFGGASGYSFADVPTDAYYADAVASAKRLGIVNGYGGNFNPTSEITRQDAMVIIKNALKVAGWKVDDASTAILGRFPDGTSVSSYAREAVSTLVQLGAVNGNNGMLYPHNSITRAEAAMILHFVMTL